MATVRKRQWRTGSGETKTAWVADYVDGQGKRRLKTFTTKKAADGWLVQARGEISRGIHVADSVAVTVTEAGETWLQRCRAEGLERSTVESYEAHLRLHILPRLGREKLSRLSTPQVESFKDHLLRTKSRAMARKVLVSLKSLLKEAQRRGLCAQNVAAPVSVGSSGRHKRKLAVGEDVPSPAEVRALIEAAPSIRWRAFLATAAFTGLRSSELRGLTWANVDLDRKELHVRERADRWCEIGSPKSSGSSRTVPLAPFVLNTLREWKLSCPKRDTGEKDQDGKPIKELCYVFPNGNGKVELHGNIRRALGPIQIRAGLTDGDGKPKYGLHAFRHFFASWLIHQGFGPKRIQALMGHATITMSLDTYGHLFPAEDDAAKFAAGELAVIGS